MKEQSLWPVTLALTALVPILLLEGGVHAATLVLPAFGEHRFSVPAAEGTPVTDYELAYPADGPWGSVADRATDLQARAFPETVTLVSADPAQRTLHIRTTTWGRSQLDNAGAKITPLMEERPDTDRCSDVSATPPARRGAKAEIIVRSGVACPYAEELYPDRQLVVEGLDRRGGRLFLSMSPDSRWAVQETIDDEGRLRKMFEGRSSTVPLQLAFRAFVDARLAKLRIWAIDGAGTGRAISEFPWEPRALPKATARRN